MLPTIATGNVFSSLPTGYDVANSCRWNFGDSPAMNKSQTSGNTKTWTYSWWCKRGVISGSAENDWFKVYASGSNLCHVRFNTNDDLYCEINNGSAYGFTTNRKFRDPSAWYHFALIMDTTQGTDTNRMKLFVNGINELTVGGFSSITYPAENADLAINNSSATFYLGTTHSATEEFDGYMADVVLLDGTAAAIGDLGEFDEDSPTIWKPKNPSGLTFGNNGFYLDFKDSANLGNDANGGTDFTESNLAATDQTTDTPTNNFATLNPLDNYYNATSNTGATSTEGNTKFVIASGNKGFARSTIGVTAGKWYWECKLHAVSKGFLGTCNSGAEAYNSTPQVNSVYIYEGVPDFRSGAQALTTGVASISTNDIMNFALDMDNHAFYIGVNNSWMNSGDPTSGSSRTGAISELFTTGRAIISDSGEMFAHLLNTSTTGGINTSMNFGNPAYANSSSVADANGYGAFEYAPPTGYLALCSKNLGSDGG